MSATTTPAPTPAPRAVERVRIDGVDWATYEKFLEAVGDRPIRLTYDRGRLEIMAPLRYHEREKRMLGRLVETLTEELNIPLESCGSMTIRREDLERGFEPDECYYVEHALQMQDRREPDFTRDPPPDLAIEVDITRSSLDRQSLYAAIGVPELWRYDDGEVKILLLQPDQTYQPAERSRCFPPLSVADINRILTLRQSQGETEVVRAFRAWVREAILPSWPGGGGERPASL